MDCTQKFPDHFVAIGTIRKTFGLDGWLWIAPFSLKPDRFNTISSVLLANKCLVLGQYNVEEIAVKNNGVLIKFIEVKSIDEAAALIHCDLYIDENDIVECDQNEYFHHDLIGLSVFHVNGDYIGKIKEVLDMPGNDVYVISTESESEYLIPAVKEVIKEISIQKNQVIIDPFDGMLI